MSDKNNKIWNYISKNNQMTSQDLHSLIKMLEEKEAEVKKNEIIQEAEVKVKNKWIKQDTSSITLDDNGSIDLDFNDVFENPKIEIEHTLSVSDALISSIVNYAKVDIGYISVSCGLSPSVVIEQLKGSIIQDPEKWNEEIFEGYVTKEEYLTGNLFLKNKIAQEANSKYDGRFSENIKAIAEVMPQKVLFDDIFITIGSPWIPVEIYQRFLKEVIGSRGVIITHDTYTGSWSVYYERRWGNDGVKLYSTFGTRRMNALELFSRTLNLNSIVIRDEVESNEKTTTGQKKTIKIINEKETQYLIEKQNLLINTFRDWISKDKFLRKTLEDIYYEKYAVNRIRCFDGSFLKFKDMSEDVHLYNYQKNAVARMLFSPNVLLAHDVGSGKTYEMIVAGHEMKRLGLSKKNMFVVPNGIISQWKQIYKKIYPKDKILVIKQSNFTPKARLQKLQEIKDGNYDAVIITYSSFGLIKLSPSFYIKKAEEKEEKLRQISNDKNTCTETVNKKLGQTIRFNKKYLKDMAKALESGEKQIYFEDLKIDRLFVDEAHNFKNISFDTKIQNVLGLNPNGSDKCDDMFDKIRIIHSQNGGKGVVFATGTPITNSVSDAFVIQKYLQPYALQMAMAENFDGWIQLFSEVKNNFEVDVDTMKYRVVSRLSQFHNLPELSSMLAEIADFHHIDNNKELPDFDEYENVIVEKNKEFSLYLKDISKRAELIRKGKAEIIGYRVYKNKNDKEYSVVRKGTQAFDSYQNNPNQAAKLEPIFDNMLVITTDGRKAALDIRLVNRASIPKVTKSEICAKKVFEIYEKTKKDHYAQLIFCDVSVPKQGFNVYDEIKEQLIFLGVNKDEIAYIHNADSDKKRDELISSVNKGKIRILLGSTFKLGTGVNVQEKLVAIHHIDVPWRPSDMIQREGRLLRPGNKCEKVYIYRYITKGSFDAYSWQLLETKQNFISSLLSNKVYERDASEIDDTVLSYAEVKAIAVGNPLVKERIETFNELQRTRLLQSKLSEEKLMMSQKISEYKKEIPKDQERLMHVKNDNIHYKKIKKLDLKEINDNQNDENKECIKKEKKKRSKDEIAQRKNLSYLIAKVVNEALRDAKEKYIADYFGFSIIAPSYYTKESEKFVKLKREATYTILIEDSPIGYILRIDNFLKELDSYETKLSKKIQMKKDYIKNAEIEFSKKDSYTDKIEELRLKLVDIDKKLEVKL